MLVASAEVSRTKAEAQTLPAAETASPKPTPSDSSIRRFVYPHDDLKNDASFQEFRRKLKEVAARRDADALYKAVSPDFFLTPRSEQGKKRKDDRRGLERFKSAFSAQLPASGWWWVLDTALEVGAQRNVLEPQAGFCGPAFEKEPVPAFRASYYMWAPKWNGHIIGSSVPLRARPDASSPEIASLSWDLLNSGLHDPTGSWVTVRLPDGRSGWVENRLVKAFDPECGELSICFAKESDREWRIRAMIDYDPCE